MLASLRTTNVGPAPQMHMELAPALSPQDVVDAFAVVDGWFEVILPSLQLVLTDEVPVALRERANHMLVRLRLGHDERVVRQRREWLQLYEEGELSLGALRKMAPLIADAVVRRDGA